MDQNIKILFAIILFVHGIGHLIGTSFLSESFNLQGFGNKSWILSDQLGLEKIYSQLIALLWLVVTIGFLIATYGFWTNQEWWKPLTGVLVVVSIGLFVLWWTAFPGLFPFQANIGNVLIILGLLWLN
ncbi:MAG: hypothetical protein ACXAC2_22055 [Candidatus Kariarchaeaceae archaeon]|jgi:hypothetical protein